MLPTRPPQRDVHRGVDLVAEVERAEVELDLTSGKPLDRFPDKDLLPTGRVGIAIRRRF